MPLQVQFGSDLITLQFRARSKHRTGSAVLGFSGRGLHEAVSMETTNSSIEI